MGLRPRSPQDLHDFAKSWPRIPATLFETTVAMEYEMTAAGTLPRSDLTDRVTGWITEATLAGRGWPPESSGPCCQ